MGPRQGDLGPEIIPYPVEFFGVVVYIQCTNTVYIQCIRMHYTSPACDSDNGDIGMNSTAQK